METIIIKNESTKIKKEPNFDSETIGIALEGYCPYFITKEVDGIMWYMIDKDKWVANIGFIEENKDSFGG